MTYNVFGGTLNLAQSINLQVAYLQIVPRADVILSAAARRSIFIGGGGSGGAS